LSDRSQDSVDCGSLDAGMARVLQAFRSTMRLHRRLMIKKMVAEGGHPGDFICLRVLAEREGISQRDLAERLHLSRPRVTTMLQSLERTGMVERRTDERDRRLLRVFLAPAGRQKVAELRDAWGEYLGQTIGSLSERDRCRLERLLNTLNERMEAILSADEEQGG
jgi:DNA-binding MarR family transcriptional regulator